MAQYILALDQGTTSSRAILFNEKGEIAHIAQREFQQIYPKPGWVEHDPNEIWESQYGVAQEVMQKAGASAQDIATIGITNQRETTIMWDRHTGEPVHNAIVWQCRRTADYTRELREEGFDGVIRTKTGLLADPYFSGTKVRWLLKNVEGLAARAEKGDIAFGTVDSWLIWKLTQGGLHITDVTNASRTMLYDIHDLHWSTTINGKFDIPDKVLPQVVPSSAVYGETAAGLFGAPISIGGIAGDQQAASFGQVALEIGMAKNTYGTGCFLVLNTGENAVISKKGLLSTIAWQLGESAPVVYALEGSIFIAGAAVQWLRDELQIIDSAPEVETLAASVEDNAGVYFVPAFVGLGAPHWDTQARGSLMGLTRGAGRGHVARAVLESLAFQTWDVQDAMRQDSGLSLDVLRVDGGAAANDLLMQIQADVLGVPVERPAVTETTALGAAYLAGLATGFWGSVDDLKQQWTLGRVFEPQIGEARREEMLHYWHKAVERAKAWEEH
ncbi:MAG: glycerol kinase GlpK [Anaerolineales bacterium]